MKILACGDVHLTNYGAFDHATDTVGMGSRLQYILKALQYFFEYGQDHQIKVYIINGDFFDKRRADNPSVLAYIQDKFIGMYREITPDGSVLLMNVGNHGELTRVPYPNSISNFPQYSETNHQIKLFETVRAWSQGKNKDDDVLMFIPYIEEVEEQKVEIQKRLNECDKTSKHITVFAHLGVDGAVQGRWNHRLSDAYSLADLGWNDPNVKSIVLSHFHSRQSLRKQGKKEAYYIGDLTELNFNDIQKNGLGAPRGFEEINTTTGEHQLIDLTQNPYNIPTFNAFDLDKDHAKNADDLLNLVKQGNYLRITTSDHHKYEALKEKLDNDNVQLIYVPKQNKIEDINVNPNATDVELVSEYCEKHYPKIKDKALDYLRKAKES